jgi:DNA polymerase-1
MVNIYKKLKESRIGAKMLVQVHDDLLFEVPKKHSAELEVLIKQEMENAVKLCVPVVVEIKKGGNWGELQQ